MVAATGAEPTRIRVVHTLAFPRRRPEQTVLHETLREGLETFLARAEDTGRPIPRFAVRELRAYLECGLLPFGFLRVHCPQCGVDRLVAFSCKGRGFCPSCGGRRMADTAAHLVDRVLPEVPMRQWVLSLPWALRFRLAYDRALCSAVLALFVRTVFAALRRRAAKQHGVERAQCGAVTFVQRFGDALNLNIHFHTLVLDGVYAPDGENSENALRFRPLPPPTDAEVERIARTLARRLERLLERRGPEADDSAFPALELDETALPGIADASVRGRIASGARSGQRVLRLGDRIDADDLPERHTPLCASASGLSLHAGVAVPAHDRRRLERLCRYVARPPIATERLSRLPDGRLLYALKRRWRDGTTHVLFESLELIERIVALIPPPRVHLVRYHGVLAPAARARARVTRDRRIQAGSDATPAPPALDRGRPAAAPMPPPRARQGREADSIGLRQAESSPFAALPIEPFGPHIGGLASFTETAPTAPVERFPRERRLTWSELMRRVFLVDVLECPSCQGRMRLIAAIDQPHLIARILDHLGLPARAPPLAPSRYDPPEDPPFDPRPARA